MQTYKLIEDNSVLLNQPKLIHAFGRTGAQFLCQIHYWIEKGCGTLHNDKHWIYNTEQEWGQQILLSTRQIRHYIKKLSDMGILIVKKIRAKNYDRTNYLTINYNALNAIINDQTEAALHEEVSSSSMRQKVPHVYTKITNKENNKSVQKINQQKEGQGKENKKENKGTLSNKLDGKIQQVRQVKNNNFKNDVRERKFETKNRTFAYETSKPDLKNNKPQNHPQQDVAASKSLHSSNQNMSKPTTIQDMLSIWNGTFKKANTAVNKELAPLLLSAFKNKFESKIDLWKNYCKRIESSSYLMGEGFALSLYWALKYQTIDRITNGEFGVKDIPDVVNHDNLLEKATHHIESLREISHKETTKDNEEETGKETPLCLDVREKLLKVLGAASYMSWFTKVSFIEKGRVVQMKSENKFVEDYITTHYGYLF